MFGFQVTLIFFFAIVFFHAKIYILKIVVICPIKYKWIFDLSSTVSYGSL